MNKIRSIYIAENMGEAMRSVDSILVTKDQGLEGDRYAEGKGMFSRERTRKIRHVSFIGFEAIQAANERIGGNFAPEDTRRNVVTEGIDLNELVDVTFSIGGVEFRGAWLCDPCSRPSKLSDKEGFKEAFEGIGGLRAEVLSSGIIAVGQSIEHLS